MKRLGVAGLLLALPVLAASPKLVVVLVVDQLNVETLRTVRPHLGPGGIARLLDEGTRYDEALYGQAGTYTGPGHACLATGTYPHKNGIVANRFYDRASGAMQTTLLDPRAPLLDAPADPGDDSSPRRLKVETVGDRLIAKDPRSKVVAISLKDRAAVLLGGHKGRAYWFSESTGKMTTSKYYASELPRWVKAFNARKLPDASFGKSVELALAREAYRGVDDDPFEADVQKLGRTFPRRVTGGLEAPGPAFYFAFGATPFAIDYEVAFVEAAIEAERLGADAVPDLLAVSFSTTDYAGHAYGPDSFEAQDTLVRLDRSVAKLLEVLDARVGRRNYAVAFTADHGAGSVPERLAAGGTRARRIKSGELEKAIEDSLAASHGAGDWVLALDDPNIYLNWALAKQRGQPMAAVEQVALKSALAIEGIRTGYTRTQLLAGLPAGAAHGTGVMRSFDPELSGDVILVPQEHCFWGKYGEKPVGSTHGSPHRYDAHVPLAFWGAGVGTAVHPEPVEMAAVAPTVAALLGVTLPQAEAAPLSTAARPAPKGP
ncbi:MAG: alkaline phosphatase family protein [Myxococcaceae bacterium]